MTLEARGSAGSCNCNFCSLAKTKLNLSWSQYANDDLIVDYDDTSGYRAMRCARMTRRNRRGQGRSTNNTKSDLSSLFVQAPLSVDPIIPMLSDPEITGLTR